MSIEVVYGREDNNILKKNLLFSSRYLEFPHATNSLHLPP